MAIVSAALLLASPAAAQTGGTGNAATAPLTPVAPSTATAVKGWLFGLQYNSTQPTFTNGQQGSAQGTARGALIVAPGVEGFAVTGTFSLPSGAATSANQSTEIASLSSIDTKLSSQATAANQTTGLTNQGTTNTNLGAPGATACATDTASCSLNQFLQRIAQRLTTLIGLDFATSAKQDTLNTSVGTTNTDIGPPGATACATDTGSCSLNALLQRLAQRLTTVNATLGTPLQAGGNVVVTSAPSTAVTNAGTFAVQAQPTPVTSGGLTVASAIVPNNTTAVVVKGSAGQVYGVKCFNNGATQAYIKIYNATSATAGSGTPQDRLLCPSSASSNGSGFIAFNPTGDVYSTGITYVITTGIADNDTTAPAASTYLVSVHYK